MTAPAVHTESRTADSRFVPLRPAPEAADSSDARRLDLAKRRWGFYDDLVRPQHRQIEENVRMLSGLQNHIYHPVLNRYIDPTEWMSPGERQWKQRHTFNRLLPWFIITHARATENQPIVTFVPGPDRADAELASVLDVAVKSVWFEANMEDVHDRVMAWVIAAGRAHTFTRVNPLKGKLRKWIGTDSVPVIDRYDQPMTDDLGEPLFSPPVDGVPFDKQGQPLAMWRDYGDGSGELLPMGEPHATPIGALEVDVLTPMNVRGSWGHQPWHQKREHLIRTYHTPEDVYEMFGVDVEPDVRGGGVADVGELERILYGTGFYGPHTGGLQYQEQVAGAMSVDGYVEVTQLWEAPSRRPGMEQTEENPGGRWLVTTRQRVLRDGPRPAALPYTSPLNTFEFVRLPGRNGGDTPLNALNHVQRIYNEGHSRLREHINLSTNPIGIIDGQSGIKADKLTNAPGQNHVVTRRPGVPAYEFVQPPRLGEEVFRSMSLMREEFYDIGFMAGANEQSHAGDSGEKLKEARFNTDRFLGPTMRRTAGEYGRMFETWRAFMPLMWDMETTLSYAGEDNLARTITVYPELFKRGFVNVRPDVESMLPEGRGERQERVYKMYMDGLFGLPGSPPALAKFWEMAHMPHLSRAGKPGGIHRTTAEQENGRILLGEPAEGIPVYEWYDDDTHLAVHETYMSSPEFEKQEQAIKDAFVLHRMAHLFNRSQKMAQAAVQQAAMSGGVDPSGKPIQSESVRPTDPEPPRGPIPGDVMPTAAATA
jgi:hypothetical protein